jgi:hypothetical protein
LAFIALDELFNDSITNTGLTHLEFPIFAKAVQGVAVRQLIGQAVNVSHFTFERGITQGYKGVISRTVGGLGMA